MKIPKLFQLLPVMLLFLHVQLSAQFSQLNIDVNVDPHMEIAMSHGTENNDLALLGKKDAFSTDVKKRRNRRYSAPKAEKELKVEGQNISLSPVSDKGHFKVKIDDGFNGEVHFQFLDSKAQLLERKTKFIHNGKNRIVFKNDYKAGAYFLTINYNGETYLKQIVIE